MNYANYYGNRVIAFQVITSILRLKTIINMDTILLIENNANILENFTEYLEIEGFKVLSARNGIKGVEIARSCMPDLIISEIVMSELDGYDVLRLILHSYYTYKIPFIFSTTKCEKRDKLLAIELGADDYLVKPFGMEILCDMARKWIRSGSKRCA